MKYLYFLILLFITPMLSAQNCFFEQAEYSNCGFVFQVNSLEGGTLTFDCGEGFVSVKEEPDLTNIHVTECGNYTLYYENVSENCFDTMTVAVIDPSFSSHNFHTNISLEYGDIDCPQGAVADCDAPSVSIDLPNGTPVPIWTFCNTTNCISTTYECTEGTIEGCLTDTITCDTITVINSFEEDCTNTDQGAFIVLNSEGDAVEVNTFLEYINVLQNENSLECGLVDVECTRDDLGLECSDSTRLDTTFLPIPVRIGGQWSISFMDSLVLSDTTYFTYEGQDYELILDPSVDYYGPGTMEVILNEITINAGNDTIREFPYGFYLELLWKEEWIYDTLEVIREVPLPDSTCLPFCGGNFFNYTFDVPSIPEFPCGPIGIDYPDECLCNDSSPNLSMVETSCFPKTWDINILNSDYYIEEVIGADATINGNNALLSSPISHEGLLIVSSVLGCDTYEFPLYFENIIDEVHIESNGQNVIDCNNNSILLHAIGMNSGNQFDFLSDPFWVFPDGSTEFGQAVSATLPGIYTVNYDDSSGCTFSDQIEITENNTITTESEFALICGDEVYTSHGYSFSESGTYEIEIACNYFIVVEIEHYEIETIIEYHEICQGEQLDLYGYSLGAGEHNLTINNGSPCPSYANIVIEEQSFSVAHYISYDCDGMATIALNYDNHDVIIEIDGEEGNSVYESSGGSFSFTTETSGTYIATIQSEICTEIEVIEVIAEPNYPTLDIPEALTINCTREEAYVVDQDASLAYSWQAPDGQVTPENSIVFTENGQHVLSVMNEAGCESTYVVNVAIIPEMTLKYVTEAACTDQENGLLRIEEIEGGLPPFELMVNGNQSTMENDILLTHGLQEVEIIQGDGCIHKEEVFIEERLGLEVPETNYLTMCNKNGLTINLPTEDGLTYTWADGFEESERLIKEGGNYDVLISDKCGTITSTFEVEDQSDEEIFVLPNVLYPSSAQGNGEMRLYANYEIESFKLSIFDRSGNLIYTTEDTQAVWDGTLNGSIVPTGTYVWLIESSIYNCKNERETVVDSGTITVLK